MILEKWVPFYLNLNVLIAAGYGILKALIYLIKKINRPLCWRDELKLHYQAFTLVVGFALMQFWIPHQDFFEAPVKIWSASSAHMVSQTLQSEANPGYVSLAQSSILSFWTTERISLACVGFFAMLLSLGALQITRQIKKLLDVRTSSHFVKKIGFIEIRSHQFLSIPFSFYLPGLVCVVIPEKFCAHPEVYRLILMHELQHHRQGDTKWILFFQIIKYFCLLNPAIHLWKNWIAETQEFACDAALVGRKNVSSHVYASCLFQVAHTAFQQNSTPACATGFFGLLKNNILKRRIEFMLLQQPQKKAQRVTLLILAILIFVFGVVTYASKGFVHDRRMTMAEAEALVTQMKDSSQVPLVINERVLKQLNRYVGTVEGRSFMRKSLQRMESYRDLVTQKLNEYRVPLELMAVPIVESGYQNLSQKKNQKTKAAGLWQFIAPTARVYGLRVSEQADDRLSADLLTDAAARYLLSNHLRFKDWRLSLMAYNLGEQALQRAIIKNGTKDPWELIENGAENDRDYLPKVIAAIVVMKNPSLVN